MTDAELRPDLADDPPAPGAHEKLDRLRTLLREMFQFDRGDLDFGLYRIMNLKSAEIAKFLDEDLLPQVKSSLRLTSVRDRAALDEDLESARKQAFKLGYNPDTQPSDVIIDLNRRLDEMRRDATAEADVYNHLANFFGRYYSEGDFISQRRYSAGGRSSYLIPYDGEEVKLHWANADQYYIKTTENYASYAFTVDAGEAAKRVRFEIAAADNEKDNIKAPDGKQRRFVLAGGDAVGVEDGELVVRFEHRPLTQGEKKAWPGNGGSQQRRINEVTIGRILSAADPDWQTPLSVSAPTEANGERTLLAKHVERYTAKNTFDYFIHKDLGGFLRQELDLYLNTEVLNLNDLEQSDAVRFDRALARLRAIRRVGGKVIDFLAQLEDFQKQLWLKKKFVLETNWCVTLDRVPEDLYPEIAANPAQCEEWVELFAVDEIHGDLANGNTSWSNPPTPEFLKANPYLVLDTKHFPRDFTDRLLAALSDAGPLDEQMDGLLIHGENFQALNLLQARYQGQVQCVYIDPPYNTGDSEILYKNGYLRSSWITLMANRLELLPGILTNDSVLYIAIDDFEMVNLAKLLDNYHTWLHRDIIIINHHPQGGKAKTLAHTHEYMIVCMPETSDKTLRGRASTDMAEKRPFKRSGTAESNFRYGRPNSFYAILVDPDSRHVVGLEAPPGGQGYPTGRTEDGYDRIYPIGDQGEERVWRRSYESCQELVLQNKLICTNKETIYQMISAEERTPALFSNWIGSRYNAGTHGANLLRDILGHSNVFSYPKSIHTVEDAIFAADLTDDRQVVDFFAGSGTTGHAIINLNRENNGRIKYILVEMADYFDTVMLPRLKKIIYSKDWKDGKPVSVRGSSQFLKLIRLECYEDALSNLELAEKSKEQIELLTEDATIAEDYKLNYMLGAETDNGMCLLGKDFKDPFSYSLSYVRDDLYKEVNVDLPETFNYLIGLHTESRRWLDGVLTITGKDAEGRTCLILWRNRDEIDYAALDAWLMKNRTKLPEHLDVIYVNGDQTLNAVRQPTETWIAETIEPVFRRLMFGAME